MSTLTQSWHHYGSRSGRQDTSPARRKMLAWSVGSSLLAALSGVLLCLALFTDYWLVAYGARDTAHSGLWHECLLGICKSQDNPAAYVQATRAFLILAFLASLIAVGSLLISMTSCFQSPAKLSLVASITAFAAGLCALIAMSVYTAKSWDKNKDGQTQVTYEWSFYLGWGALPLLGLSGVFALVTRNRQAGYEQM